ncbi:Thiamin ABC transporter, substrate-binding protein component [Rubellimicrobium mesophilum DSM 19309]|uniref:Thiamine-binding periplasmic protein n=1 Tax=Rubellimicrobium mesophilum DSM 19309 TaxID=442562 RepID=A0A017HMZ0_9RHOB|nr:thiamine ABC transporter substrate binding subunit [Rubellimicrobium mesophilum]EYD75139.1 Thiamin ABC transporter, substrate-binding protein component [Rubellimicrobium mesophilum DSM 19309]
MRPTLAALLALAAAPAFAEGKPVLTVLAYDSFTAEWGPGPAVEAAFEAECGCDLRFVTAGDGAALLARLQLEGETTDADVVLGLDSNLVAAAKATGLFAPHGAAPKLDLPVEWTDDTFLPFDWGWFSVVGKAGGPMPTSFRELADSDATLVIEDPRSSTPGLGLVLWIEAAYGEEAPAVWAALRDNIVTVTPGWTEAYNLFLEGEADLVLSYTTSPAYHLIAEQDPGYVALPFEEGHYLQVEVAGKVASTDQPELADRFLAFMLTEGFQGTIATGNWMYPAVTPAAGLPDGFESVRPETTLYLAPEEAEALRGPAIERWRTALAQ